MKKIFILSFLIIFCFFVGYAQDKKVEFGIQSGYSYNMPKGTDANAVTGSLNGIHVGPIMNFKIDEMFGIQTGLLYNYFNSINKYNVVLNNWSQSNTTAHYFDLPLRLQYTVPLADDFYVHVLAGPNFNYGINKHMNIERVVNKKVVDDLTEKGENIYANKNEYSPLDLQFGIGVAVQYYHFSVRAGYDWGLTDRNTTSSTSFKANDIKLGIAYTF
ncbi:hypothetical protein TRIP_D440052 [uncultured Paludibacter sp.]|nr:hypothetical protein TRIP_D440052 [uncultured Paludibacter sp.]